MEFLDIPDEHDKSSSVVSVVSVVLLLFVSEDGLLTVESSIVGQLLNISTGTVTLNYFQYVLLHW